MQDCHAAIISQLPNDRRGRELSTTVGPMIRTGSPSAKTVGSCAVRVEMQHQGSLREAFSWMKIVQATLRLSRECLGPWQSTERGAGACTHFGNHGRIASTVRYCKAVGDGGNVEMASSLPTLDLA